MNKESLLSDEHLITLAQNGNNQACNLLLERYNSKIHQIIHYYIYDQATVKDLTQEVLLKVYRHLHYFKEESQFSTWLYRIIQNTIKNYFRSSSLRSDSEAHFANEQYTSPAVSPESLLMGVEFGTQIENAISKLSDDLRICYGLHTFDGQTYEDIARDMSCPIGTVRSRIFRARKCLHELCKSS